MRADIKRRVLLTDAFAKGAVLILTRHVIKTTGKDSSLAISAHWAKICETSACLP